MNALSQKVRYDWTLVIHMLLLMGVGLLSLRSALPAEELAVWWNQVVRYAVAILVFFLFARMDYRRWSGYAGAFFLATLFLLVLVLLIGKTGGGSQRWLGAGPLRIQPSELMKVATIIWVAHFCAQYPRPGGAVLSQLLVPGIAIMCAAGLTILQPDLGTGLLIASGGLAVLFVAGIRGALLAKLTAASVVVATFAWSFLLRPYQKRRLLTFMNPDADPLGAGYHTIQSKIAIGSGGVLGAGYGQGTQTGLRFLPEQHTDFIFSVWAEEWGFLGGLFLLLLFGSLLWHIARIAIEAKDTFGRLLAAGILCHFGLHIFINLAMVAGIAPVVGVPLPWVSYGGSAILTNTLCLSILSSVHLRKHVF